MTQRTLAVADDLRRLTGRLGRRLRDEATLGDFTPSQKSVISRLARDGPTTPTVLARAEGMRPQSMGTILSVLTTAGIVASSPDPTDGRRTIVDLTPTARKAIRAGLVARQDWLFQTVQTRLSPAEQDELARGLALLERLLAP